MNPSSVWAGEDYHNQGYAVEGDFGNESNYYANSEPYEGVYEEDNVANSYSEGYVYPQVGDVQGTLTTGYDEQPLPEGWVQYWTAEGWPYFYHAATDSSSWERPTEHTLEQNLSNAAEGSPYNVNHANVNSSSKSNESQHSMTLTYSHSPLPNNTHSLINHNAAHSHTANEDPFTPPQSELLDLDMDEIYQEDTPNEGAQSGAFSRGIPGLVSSFPTAVTAEQFFSPLPEFSEHIPLSPDEPLLDLESNDAPDMGAYSEHAPDSVDLMNASHSWADSSVTAPVYAPPVYDYSGNSANKEDINGSNNRYHIDVDLPDHSTPAVLDEPADLLHSLPTTPTPVVANSTHRTQNYVLDKLEFSPASISEPAFTFNHTDYAPPNHSTVPYTPYSSSTANANAHAMNNSLYMSPTSPFSGESEIFKCLSESNDNNEQTMIDRSRSGFSIDGYNRGQSNISIGERLEGGEDNSFIEYPPEQPSHNDAQTPHTLTSDNTHNTHNTHTTHHTNTSFLTNNSQGGRIFFSRASDLDVAALISDDSGSDAEPDAPNTSTNNNHYHPNNNNTVSMHYDDSEGEEGNPGDDFMLSYAPPPNPHPSTMYAAQPSGITDMNYQAKMYSPPLLSQAGPPQSPLQSEHSATEVHVQNNMSNMDLAQSSPPTTHPAPSSQVQFASPELVYADIYQNNQQLSPMGGEVSNASTKMQFASNVNPYHAGTSYGQNVFQDIDYAIEDPTEPVYVEGGYSHPDYDAENAYLRSAEDPYSSEQQHHSEYKDEDVHNSSHAFKADVSGTYPNYENDTINNDGNDGDATPGPNPTADPYDWYGSNNNNNKNTIANVNNSNYAQTYSAVDQKVQAESSEYHEGGIEEPLHMSQQEQLTTTDNYNNNTDYTNNHTSHASMDPHEVAWLQYEQLRDSGALDNAPTVTPSNIDLSSVHRDNNNIDYVSSPSDTNSHTNSVSKESKYAKLRQSLTNKPKGSAATQFRGKGGMQTQQQTMPKEEPAVVPTIPVPVSPWVECVTGEGDVYYYNTVTEHVQWENPHEVASVEANVDLTGVTSAVDATAVGHSDGGVYSEPVYDASYYNSEPVVETVQPTVAVEQLQDHYQQTYQPPYQEYQPQQQFSRPAVSSITHATSDQSVVSGVPSVAHSSANNSTNAAAVSAAVKTSPRKGMVTLNTVAAPSTTSNSGNGNSVSHSYQARPYSSTTNTYAHSSNTSSVSALSRQALGHSTTTSVSVPAAANMNNASSQRRLAAEATGLQYPTSAPATATTSNSNNNIYPQLSSITNPVPGTSRYIPYPVQERAQMYEHVNVSTYPHMQPSAYSPGSEERVDPTDRNGRIGDSEQEGEESETDSTIHSPLARYMRHMPLGNRASTVSISSLSDNESTDFGYAGSVQGSVQGAFIISHGVNHGSPNHNNNNTARVLSPMYHPNDYSNNHNQANTAGSDRHRESGEISPLAYPSPYEHPDKALLSPPSDTEVVVTPPPAASVEETDSASQASSVSQTQRHLEIWDRFFRNAFLVTQQGEGQSQQGDETKLTQAAVTESIRKIRQKAANSRSKGATAVARWPHTLSQRRYTALIDFALRRHAADANSTQATQVSETNQLEQEEQALLDDHSANGSVTSIDGTLMSMALLAAVLHEDIQSAERLLKNGANPSCVDDQIRTPAHYACRVGNVAILALLFDHDAELEATDAAGRTPLHTAAIFGRLEAMEFLLGCAVDSNNTDLAGNAPLHLAARAGFEEGCRLLLNFNASTLTRNLMGMTPLGVAQIMRPQSAALQAVVAMLSSPEQTAVSYGEHENVGYEPNRVQPAAERLSVRFNVGSGGSDSGGSVDGGSARVATTSNMSNAVTKSVQSRVDSWRQQAASAGLSTQDTSTYAVGQHNAVQYDGRQHTRATSQSGYGQYEGAEYINPEHQHHNGDESASPGYSHTELHNYDEEHDHDHQQDDGEGDEDNEEEEEDEEGNSVADLVASSVWGVAASLIDITLSMFSNPNNDKNNSSGRTRKDNKQAYQEEDSLVEDENYTSRPLRSLSQSHINTAVTAAPVAAAPARGSGSLWNMFGMAGSSRSEPVPEREESSDSLVGLSSAPPTDRELSERGLGFPTSGNSPPPFPPAAPFIPTSPPHQSQQRSGIKIMTPPALVAREIGEHIARSASSTPQRDLPPTPPSEVMVAVALNKAEQMRLHAQQTQRRAPPPVSRSMMDDDGPSPPLPLQLHGHGHGHGSLEVFSGPSAGSLLHSGDDGSVRESEHTNANSMAAAATTTSPPTSGNGYSLGASLPRGVQWRYVDVLNKQA